jgi:Pyruvate/2-oxoacid:ferredoxin oxidoreductase delta subunit
MMNKKLKIVLWIVGILALLMIIGRVTANTLTLSKIRDRQQDYVLPDSLKRELSYWTGYSTGDALQIKQYCMDFTADKLEFAQKNDINHGKANCVGYAKFCAAVYNYISELNGYAYGHAKPVVGTINLDKFDLCAIVSSYCVDKNWRNFTKDHDFVEFNFGEGCRIRYADPCLYDAIGMDACTTVYDK